MTKKSVKKLTVSRETLHALDNDKLRSVAAGEREGGGGSSGNSDTPVCFYTTHGG
jgi:hypothetical protein